MEACREESQVKLLGWRRSPYVTRVRIALALKGIDYEFILEDSENKSQLLLQSNPIHKKVPVFFHNGKTLSESTIILEYIEEAWETKAPNLMPKHPYDRALARFWAAFVDDKLLPSVWGLLKWQGEEQQKAVKESLANFSLLEEALRTSSCSGKAYFGGDEIGLVDIALGGPLVHIKNLEKVINIVLVDPVKLPLLSAWMARFSETDELKRILPDPADVFEYLSAKRAKVMSTLPGI
uniref:glutathione transferase n=1 Tax=Pinus yunnanensis TaxID=88732 RepID=A0A9E8S161_PINYU|nr:tau class glutathione S-transferases [Pinus yunnanensis]